MRALTFCFAASMVLWCTLTWCAFCAGTLAGSTVLCSSILNLTASFVAIGLAGIVVALWLAAFCEADDMVEDLALDEMTVD